MTSCFSSYFDTQLPVCWFYMQSVTSYQNKTKLFLCHQWVLVQEFWVHREVGPVVYLRLHLCGTNALTKFTHVGSWKQQPDQNPVRRHMNQDLYL